MGGFHVTGMLGPRIELLGHRGKEIAIGRWPMMKTAKQAWPRPQLSFKLRISRRSCREFLALTRAIERFYGVITAVDLTPI